MTNIEITYDGNMATTAVKGNSPITLHTDGSKESYEAHKALTPVDMFATSVGACMLSVLGMVAGRKGLDIKGAKAAVDYTQDATTHAVNAISVEITLPALNLGEADKKLFEAAVKACPVGLSISHDIRKEVKLVF